MGTKNMNSKIDDAAASAKGLVAKAKRAKERVGERANVTAADLELAAERAEHGIAETAEEATHAVSEATTKVLHSAEEVVQKVAHRAKQLVSKVVHKTRDAAKGP
ncbi:MAG: hypothetical protein IPG50_37305 [Myxococcales bacterium]|nr:hypothetical protein [Myxococcales bacterium]